jgi:hypothetical protein
MKLYVAVTGIAFLALFLAHVARVFVEGFHLAAGLVFAATSIASLALSIWALALYRKL